MLQLINGFLLLDRLGFKFSSECLTVTLLLLVCLFHSLHVVLEVGQQVLDLVFVR